MATLPEPSTDMEDPDLDQNERIGNKFNAIDMQILEYFKDNIASRMEDGQEEVTMVPANAVQEALAQAPAQADEVSLEGHRDRPVRERSICEDHARKQDKRAGQRHDIDTCTHIVMYRITKSQIRVNLSKPCFKLHSWPYVPELTVTNLYR
ncbi:hypothetical protein ACROYT_G014674 [Oculina patagonica]